MTPLTTGLRKQEISMTTQAAIRTVRGALEQYGFDPTAPIELVKYRENYVFRLISDSGDSYAIRLHRAGYRTDAEINTELAYLHALAEHGLSVSQPVATLKGDFVCVVTAEDGTVFQLDVLRWVEGGVPLGDITEAMAGESSLDPAVFRQLGVLTAELHTSTSAIGRVEAFRRQAWDADGLIGDSAQWGNPLALQSLGPEDESLLESGVAKLRQDLSALPKSVDAYGVIHADLTPENVLVGHDGQMVLIDFDDFGEGWHLFDLATIMFFFQPHPLYENYRGALFEGYASARALPDGFLQSWDSMLLSRGLTYLGWASTRRGDEAAEFIVERVVPMVLGLARNYISKSYTSTAS